MATETYHDNAWTCFFWGLVVCLILGIVVYILG